MSEDYVERRNAAWKHVFPNVQHQGVWGRFERVLRYYHARTDKLLTKYGIKSNEYDVLSALLLAVPHYVMTPTEITAIAYRTPGTITNVLDKLEEKKLIERQANEKSRRSIKILLTTEGERVIRQAFLACEELEDELLSVFSEDEKILMRTLLKKMLVNWEENNEVSSPDGIFSKLNK